MDIAKYIGLFLLKNSFCYLHGLGNLELKKKSATYDGDALHAPEYDVVLTPGGSIDDTLANYIATHEQTSISKAANALREFSTATRAELAAGKEVEIPAIGKFVEQNGVIRFVTNPHLQHVPPPVPMLKMAKRLEEVPDFRRDAAETSDNENRTSVAWGKIALAGVLLVAIIAAIVFGLRYMNSSTTETTRMDTAANQTITPAAATPKPADTLANIDTTSQISQPLAAPGSGQYTVVLNSYTNRGSADKRVTTLSNNGNKVEVLARDSANYMVVMRVASSPADTVRMLDSLRRFFNPKGVYILK